MSKNPLLLILALAVCAAAVFCLTSVGVLARRTVQEIDGLGGAAYLAEPAVDLLMDRLNESGYGDSELLSEDPLLRNRVLVVTEGMNERVARRVVRQLRYLALLNESEPITLYLSTPGGWLDAAFAITDTMRSIKPPVNVVAMGGCYSAGTVVLAGATGSRSATADTLLSVHVNDYLNDGPLGPDTTELRRFRRIYADRTNVPMEWFEAPGDNQFYFDASEALEMRLIDSIVAPREEQTPSEDGRISPAA